MDVAMKITPKYSHTTLEPSFISQHISVLLVFHSISVLYYNNTCMGLSEERQMLCRTLQYPFMSETVP